MEGGRGNDGGGEGRRKWGVMKGERETGVLRGWGRDDGMGRVKGRGKGRDRGEMREMVMEIEREIEREREVVVKHLPLWSLVCVFSIVRA